MTDAHKQTKTSCTSTDGDTSIVYTFSEKEYSKCIATMKKTPNHCRYIGGTAEESCTKLTLAA